MNGKCNVGAARRSLWWLLAFCILPLAFGLPRARAGTFSCTWNFTNIVSEPLAIKRVVIEPFARYGVAGNALLTGDVITRQTAGSGALTQSNLFNGRSYRIYLYGAQTPWGTNFVTIFTNSFDTNVTGLVNGADPSYLAAPIRDTSTIAYSQAAADLLFISTNTLKNYVLPGTNVSFLTNVDGSLTISSTASGGGGGGTTLTNEPTGLPGVITADGTGLGTNFSIFAMLTDVTAATNNLATTNYVNAATNGLSAGTFDFQSLTNSTLTNLLGASVEFMATNYPAITNFTVPAIIDAGVDQQLGFGFVVSNAITITHLGRYILSGNSQTHTLRLWDTTNCEVMAATTLNASGLAVGYNYRPLTQAVVCLPGHQYFVSSSELQGGDQLYQTTPIQTSTWITNTTSMLSRLTGNLFCYPISAGQAYGPVNFLFSKGATYQGWAYQGPSNQVATANASVKSNFYAANVEANLARSTNISQLDTGSFYQKTPPLRLNPWLAYYALSYGGTPSQLEWITNALFFKTNGQWTAGWRWMEFDDNWTSTNRLANGRMGWATNKFAMGIPALADFFHTNGFKFTAYLSAPGTNTCALLFGTPPEKLYSDVTDIMQWGFDGLRIDNSCGGPGGGNGWGTQSKYQVLEMLRIVNQAAGDAGAWARSNVINRALVTHIGLNMYPGTASFTNGLVPVEAFYNENGIMTYGGASLNTPAGIVDSVESYVWPYRPFVRPGHWVDLQGVTPNQVANSNNFRMLVETRAMGAVTWAMTDEFGKNYNYMPWSTNAEFYGYYLDPAVICGRVASSNNLERVWVRAIGNDYSGTNLVCFINLATNGAVNQTISAADLNVSSNRVMVLRDPWANANVTTFTGYYTFSNSSTNTRTFVIFPQNTLGNFVGSGTFSTPLNVTNGSGTVVRVRDSAGFGQRIDFETTLGTNSIVSSGDETGVAHGAVGAQVNDFVFNEAGAQNHSYKPLVVDGLLSGAGGWFTNRFTWTNALTGSWGYQTAGAFYESNYALGSWLLYTNSTLTFSNAVSGAWSTNAPGALATSGNVTVGGNIYATGTVGQAGSIIKLGSNATSPFSATNYLIGGTATAASGSVLFWSGVQGYIPGVWVFGNANGNYVGQFGASSAGGGILLNDYQSSASTQGAIGWSRANNTFPSAYFINPTSEGQVVLTNKIGAGLYATLMLGASVYPPLAAIPTNAILAWTGTATNWTRFNWNGTNVSICTNITAAGSFIIERPTVTVTAWP